LPRLWRALSRRPVIVRPDAFYLGTAHRAEWPVSSLLDGLAAAQEGLARRRYRVHIKKDDGHGLGAGHVGPLLGLGPEGDLDADHLAGLHAVLAPAATPGLAGSRGRRLAWLALTGLGAVLFTFLGVGWLAQSVGLESLYLS
jgi:hypothetical protein